MIFALFLICCLFYMLAFSYSRLSFVGQCRATSQGRE